MSMNIHTGRTLEVSSSIVEWDMKRAGINLMREYELLPESEIDRLESIKKYDADVEIGNMQRNGKLSSEKLEKAFTEVMEKFLKLNNLEIATDIISIKKDAAFVINKTVKVDKIGNFIQFVPKNKYQRYLFIKPLEFYITTDWKMDIKGLSSDSKTRESILKAHENGMLNFIRTFLEYAEMTRLDKRKMYEFLHEFVVLYKKKELDFDYYREFNISNKYRYQFLGSETLADNIDDSMLSKVNIEYNYINIIMPLIDLVINY